VIHNVPPWFRSGLRRPCFYLPGKSAVDGPWPRRPSEGLSTASAGGNAPGVPVARADAPVFYAVGATGSPPTVILMQKRKISPLETLLLAVSRLQKLKEEVEQMAGSMEGDIRDALIFDGAQIVVRPEFVRRPLEGEHCPWTGFSLSQVKELQERIGGHFQWPRNSKRPVTFLHLPTWLNWMRSEMQDQRSACPAAL
jgi:hypothetical protein